MPNTCLGLKKKKKMSKSDVLNLTYGKLLLDDRLFLEDRAAFACLYVSDELLLPVLHFISNHQSRQRYLMYHIWEWLCVL